MELIVKATWNFLIVIVGVYLYAETGQSAPIFKLPDKKVLEGTTIILPCEPAGFPKPNITWLFNDDPIPWEHSIDNDYLILNNVRHGRHDGRYTCVATSKAGTVFTSASLIVHVIVKPVISIKPTDQRKQEGSDVIFRIKTTGFPSPAIKWLFNDGPTSWNHSISAYLLQHPSQTRHCMLSFTFSSPCHN
ncbi:cell adhesion molecule-related/down-regulated by oncogenes-like [Actinia tenebrosa]|uniref:Cell adhesion molecule-related/down-regulated by oncogenes-like n=1 Tax=Actinia tenebrosa TaxID=6105 RepID=A0A6P8J7U7_ACTTE|nr:cell adhesion molecule-related/down-regulated by oncogenes-like [Actinia tenebrosa]